MNDSSQGLSQPRLPQRFLEVAQQVAQSAGLDTHRVANGDTIDFGGVTFNLRHHALDPHGMLVELQIGDIGERATAPALKALLTFHHQSPAAVSGYFAMHADTGALMFCRRVDLQHEADPCATIVLLVRLAASQNGQFSAAISALKS